MRKYSKYVVVAGALAALAAPTAAMADAPNGTYTVVPKANANASLIGQESSQIKQNGQFVSGNANSSVIPDQTTTPGSRARSSRAFSPRTARAASASRSDGLGTP